MSTKDRIRQLCQEKGMSLTVLEATLGLGNGTITKWNKSDPNAGKLQKVADFFNVSVDYLLERTDAKSIIDPNSIDGMYLSIAKDMQNQGIDPEDIRLAIDTILKLRGKE